VLADSAYMLVFRILHITAGVLWVGSVFLFTTSIAPAQRERATRNAVSKTLKSVAPLRRASSRAMRRSSP